MQQIARLEKLPANPRWLLVRHVNIYLHCSEIQVPIRTKTVEKPINLRNVLSDKFETDLRRFVLGNPFECATQTDVKAL